MQCRRCLCELRIRSSHTEENGRVRVLEYSCTNKNCPLCGQEQKAVRVPINEVESP